MIPSGCCRRLAAALLCFGFLPVACATVPESAAPTAPQQAAPVETAPRELAPPPPLPAQPGITYLSLGKRFLAAHQPDMAMKAFHASINAEGMSAEALSGAGIAAEQQGLMTLSRRYLEQAVRFAPDSVIARNNLGLVLYRLKEYYPARDEFRTAFALSSGESEIAARYLNRLEAVITLIETDPGADISVSHEVVRLGSSEFQLIEAAPRQADAPVE